jgi:putative transposase
LNEHDFRKLFEARRVLGEWREEYNTKRPHKALEWKTPMEFAKSFVLTENSQPSPAIVGFLRGG